MDQQKTSYPVSSLPFSGLFLFFLILFLTSAPVIMEQMNKPEKLAFKLLARSERWHTVATSTSQSQWDASDGSSAQHVDYKLTRNGLKVILAPTELTTREAFFSAEARTTETFRLSTQVETPAGCHNGLVFRGNEQGEYYLFLVSPFSYTVEILQRRDNADRPREAIVLPAALPKSVGQPQTITVIGDGQSYWFYINNVFVTSMTDPRLNGDRTGVEVFT